MAYRVEVTARAVRDLRRIYGAIEAANSQVAHRWFNGLEAAIVSLNDSPARSPQTPESPNLRHLIYGSKSYAYRIIYRIDEERERVTVLHIRHGSRAPL